MSKNHGNMPKNLGKTYRNIKEKSGISMEIYGEMGGIFTRV